MVLKQLSDIRGTSTCGRYEQKLTINHSACHFDRTARRKRDWGFRSYAGFSQVAPPAEELRSIPSSSLPSTTPTSEARGQVVRPSIFHLAGDWRVPKIIPLLDNRHFCAPLYSTRWRDPSQRRSLAPNSLEARHPVSHCTSQQRALAPTRRLSKHVQSVFVMSSIVTQS